jgi:ABC-type branched-subunit amino acid transport system substrate-binding protein
MARRAGLDAIFLNVSFVDANKLAQMLGPDGDGVIITEVVPHVDSTLPIVQEYRKALAGMPDPSSPNFVSLEGYIAARTLLRAIDKINGPVTSEAITDALEKLGEFDLGLGEPLRLSPQEHQASHRVWATKLTGGNVFPFEWNGLKRRD